MNNYSPLRFIAFFNITEDLELIFKLDEIVITVIQVLCYNSKLRGVYFLLHEKHHVILCSWFKDCILIS